MIPVLSPVLSKIAHWVGILCINAICITSNVSFFSFNIWVSGYMYAFNNDMETRKHYYQFDMNIILPIYMINFKHFKRQKYMICIFLKNDMTNYIIFCICLHSLLEINAIVFATPKQQKQTIKTFKFLEWFGWRIFLFRSL